MNADDMNTSNHYARRINWTLTLFLSLSAQQSYCQQYSVIKINALGVATHRLGVAIEYSFKEKMSAQLMFESGQYAQQDDWTTGGDNYKVSGYSIIPEIRFYPFRGLQKSPEGLFAGLSFRYLRFTEQYLQHYGGGLAYLNLGTLTNLGLDLGYKYSTGKFWIEFLVGYGVKGSLTYDYPANSNFIPSSYSNDVFLKEANKFVRAELSLGYVLSRK
jgi:hypothetical protein